LRNHDCVVNINSRRCATTRPNIHNRSRRKRPATEKHNDLASEYDSDRTWQPRSFPGLTVAKVIPSSRILRSRLPTQSIQPSRTRKRETSKVYILVSEVHLSLISTILYCHYSFVCNAVLS